ncbi:hypothetical protein Dole_1346 [Desulfosudis oleivorans Hxd3]|uniref:Uncharacterized protein n=1 Tax=Desulfosudis oleivorans (strain DSM 6200 / JCM 39069 / Hxd3) TaxID=96561 RepID=A8ZYP5_DESOH|nr:hypothetical protein Dole_1346 [Desulfosudis oleivorans Hxd3]
MFFFIICFTGARQYFESFCGQALSTFFIDCQKKMHGTGKGGGRRPLMYRHRFPVLLGDWRFRSNTHGAWEYWEGLAYFVQIIRY